MDQILGVVEISILSLTLLITVYYSYRNNVIQKQVITTQYLNEFRTVDHDLRIKLESLLGVRLRDGVSIEALKVLENDQGNRQVLLAYLNNYESLARNLSIGMYDEKLVRLARASSFTNVYFNFEGFIHSYRDVYDRQYVWTEFEKIAKKWQAESWQAD
jgi:hypothetical protein